MSKKRTNGLKMSCPVPPWTPRNIVKLAQYLGVSQAKMSEYLGISYSALRAWIDGRSKSISQSILSRLEKFENKIPQLRKKAEEHFSQLVEKEERKKFRLPKPWPVSRIRSFMHTWGMSQVEFAIFAGVSYDTITSWSRGRRRLVRRETAEHISFAEKVALDRGFEKQSSENKENPWVALREFTLEEKVSRGVSEIPRNCQGVFAIQTIEKNPQEFRLGKKNETLRISSRRKKDELEVVMTLGKREWQFHGTWRTLGGVKIIELQTGEDEPLFMNGRAGCITPSKNQLRVSLWAVKDLPVRFCAVTQ